VAHGQVLLLEYVTFDIEHNCLSTVRPAMQHGIVTIKWKMYLYLNHTFLSLSFDQQSEYTVFYKMCQLAGGVQLVDSLTWWGLHQREIVSSVTTDWRLAPHSRGFYNTQRRAAGGRTPLDEWSARRRDLYLTTQNTNDRHPCPRWDSNPRSEAGARPLGPAWNALQMQNQPVRYHT
jgi:hypothetical protein